MKSLILKVTCMRKLTTSSGYVVYVHLYVTVNKTKNIDMSTFCITLEDH